MNVARLNMSHGDHASHQKTIDLVKEFNAQFEEKVVAIMLDTKAYNLSRYHKPELEVERERMILLCWHSDQVELCDDDDFIVLACDGIWKESYLHYAKECLIGP